MSDIATTEPTVTITVILNPLRPKDEFEKFTVPFEQGARISDYITDIGDAVVGYRGIIVENVADVVVLENTEIIVCPVPRGGSGGAKSLLRVVAFVAVAAFAGWAVGANGLFGSAGLSGFTAALVKTGIMIAGGVLINELLPFEQAGAGESSPTYGLSGPQNTAKEGGVVPVVYGQHIMAGNRIGNYIENDRANKTQYFVSLYNLGEGPIAGVSNIRVNDQPIENYNDAIQAPIVRFGEADQSIVDWFGVTKTPINLGSVLVTNDDWFAITTNQEIDDFAINFNLTEGLYARARDGDLYQAGKGIQIRHKKVGSGTWTYVGSTVDHYEVWYVINDGSLVETQTLPVGYFVQWNINLPNYRGIYKLVSGKQVWVGQVESRPVYTNKTYTPNIPNNGWPNLAEGPVLYLVDTSTSPLRFTLNLPGRIPEGFYDIEVRTVPIIYQYTNGGLNYAVASTSAQPLAIESVDQIIYEQVKHNNTALLALKVKITDTITSIPSVTYTHLGKKILVRRLNQTTKFYEWSFEASNNPAWVTYDVMTVKRYGGGYDPNEIDLDKFQEWADYCDEKNYTFNGVFDTSIPIWDAINAVTRCGCAQLIMVGNKYSVFIDKAETPSMMFNDANIIQGSVQTNWLPFADRANEIIMEFLDETNNFTNRTARIVGPDIPPNEDQKTISLSGFGITGIEQATKLATLQLNKNRRQIKTITFQTGVDSLAVGPGDVFGFQSGVMEWGYGGRLAQGSTNLILNLDSPIEMITGVNYKIAVHYDYLIRASGTIHSVVGTYVYLNGFFGDEKVRILKIGVNEYPVTAIIDNGAGLYGVQIKAPYMPSSGLSYDLYDLDVIESRAVVNPGTGQYQSVTLTSALPLAPSAKMRWMFGTEQQIEEKYRVIKVDSGSEGYTRTVEGLQYDDDVYADPTDILALEPIVGYGSVGHIENLAYTTASRRIGAQTETVVRLFWDKPVSGVYAGARIYVAYGEFATAFKHIDTVTNVTDWTDKTAVIGAIVTYKVVAFDSVGKTATLAGAPFVTFTVENPTQEMDPPASLTASTGLPIKISLVWEPPTINLGNIATYEVWRNTVSNVGTATFIISTVGLKYDDSVSPDITYYYWVRAVDTNGRPGLFSPVAAGSAAPAFATLQEVLDGVAGNKAVSPEVAVRAAEFEEVLNNSNYSLILNKYGTTYIGAIDIPPPLDEEVRDFPFMSFHRAGTAGHQSFISYDRSGSIKDVNPSGTGESGFIFGGAKIVGHNDSNDRAILMTATMTNDGTYADSRLHVYEVDRFGEVTNTTDVLAVKTTDISGTGGENARVFGQVACSIDPVGIAGGSAGFVCAALFNFQYENIGLVFSEDKGNIAPKKMGKPGNFSILDIPNPVTNSAGYNARVYTSIGSGEAFKQIVGVRGGFLVLTDTNLHFIKLTVSAGKITGLQKFILAEPWQISQIVPVTPNCIATCVTQVGEYILFGMPNGQIQIYEFEWFSTGNFLYPDYMDIDFVKTIQMPTTKSTFNVGIAGGLILGFHNSENVGLGVNRDICAAAWDPVEPQYQKTKLLKANESFMVNTTAFGPTWKVGVLAGYDTYIFMGRYSLFMGKIRKKFAAFKSDLE